MADQTFDLTPANAGFEDGDLSGWDAAGSFVIVGDAQAGANAAATTGPTGVKFMVRTVDVPQAALDLQATHNLELEVRVWSKTTATGGASVSAYAGDYGDTIGTETLEDAAEYTEMVLTRSANDLFSDGSLTIDFIGQHDNESGDRTYFDSLTITLKAIDTGTGVVLPKQQYDLTPDNSGFEDDFAGWNNGDGDFVIVADALSGSKAAQTVGAAGLKSMSIDFDMPAATAAMAGVYAARVTASINVKSLAFIDADSLVTLRILDTTGFVIAEQSIEATKAYAPLSVSGASQGIVSKAGFTIELEAPHEGDSAPQARRATFDDLSVAVTMVPLSDVGSDLSFTPIPSLVDDLASYNTPFAFAPPPPLPVMRRRDIPLENPDGKNGTLGWVETSGNRYAVGDRGFQAIKAPDDPSEADDLPYSQLPYSSIFRQSVLLPEDVRRDASRYYARLVLEYTVDQEVNRNASSYTDIAFGDLPTEFSLDQYIGDLIGGGIDDFSKDGVNRYAVPAGNLDSSLGFNANRGFLDLREFATLDYEEEDETRPGASVTLTIVNDGYSSNGEQRQYDPSYPMPAIRGLRAYLEVTDSLLETVRVPADTMVWAKMRADYVPSTQLAILPARSHPTAKVQMFVYDMVEGNGLNQIVDSDFIPDRAGNLLYTSDEVEGLVAGQYVELSAGNSVQPGAGTSENPNTFMVGILCSETVDLVVESGDYMNVQPANYYYAKPLPYDSEQKPGYDQIGALPTYLKFFPVCIAEYAQVRDVDLSPRLELFGETLLRLFTDQAFEEPGYEARDPREGDLTSAVNRSGDTATATPRIQPLNYSVQNSQSLESQDARTMQVQDYEAPDLRLRGGYAMTLYAGDEFREPGWTATDQDGNDIADSVERWGTVDTSTPGEYALTYRATDSGGREDVDVRTVTVAEVPTPPAEAAELEIGNPITGLANSDSADDYFYVRAPSDAAYVKITAEGPDYPNTSAVTLFASHEELPDPSSPDHARSDTLEVLQAHHGSPYVYVRMRWRVGASNYTLRAEAVGYADLDGTEPSGITEIRNGQRISKIGMAFDSREDFYAVLPADARDIRVYLDNSSVDLYASAQPMDDEVGDWEAVEGNGGTSALLISEGPGPILYLQLWGNSSVETAISMQWSSAQAPIAGSGQAPAETLDDPDYPPTLTLDGASELTIDQGDPFNEPGYTATDAVDGDLTSSVVVSGDVVDTSTPGDYVINYTVTDSAGGQATAARTVTVNAATVITLEGDNPLTLTIGDAYVEPGYSASDAEDGDLTGEVSVDTSSIDSSNAGEYSVVYSVTDSDGATATATRTVIYAQASTGTIKPAHVFASFY